MHNKEPSREHVGKIISKKLNHLNTDQFKQAKTLFNKYEDIFSVSNDKSGRVINSEFDIDTTNIKPVAVPLRRIPVHRREIVEGLLEKYKNLGWIEECDSPFRAATVLVEKKNIAKSDDVSDQYRLATDYRILNKAVVNTAWPSPSIEDCLEATKGSTLFSCIDFNSGFHQLPCTKRAKEALAFSPGYGFSQFTWCVMPEGVKSASGTFQKTMCKTFKGHENCLLPPFYDDVTVKGKHFSDHLSNLETVFNDIRKAGLTLNLLKCFFFLKEINYLGHIVGDGVIKIDPSRVESIRTLPVPLDKKAVKRFIGMAQFCRNFLPSLNIHMAPLYDLLKNNVPFVWDKSCQDAFTFVKDLLSSAPILKIPGVNDRLILETDACNTGVGVCLKFVDSRTNKEHIIGFGSHKFTTSENNWNIIEKECFAVVFGLRQYRHFLIGAKFVIKVDNRVVSYLQSKNDLKNQKLLKWALELNDFDYSIVHIPSRNNQMSDCLSRITYISSLSDDFITSNISVNEFLQEQKCDKELQPVFTYLNDRSNKNMLQLGPFKRDRRHLHVSSTGRLMWKDKLVVPAIFKVKILETCHSNPMSGHFAEERTMSKFVDTFYWPNALKDVRNWVRSCDACNKFNPPSKGYCKSPLKPINTDSIFELVCYDIAGPFFPVTKNGNAYVLIMVDHFSKWVELSALKDINAATLARSLLDNWCCRYGVPDRLLSDGARNVHGHVIKELCKLIGVGKCKSSRLHPQGDGKAEAYVKFVKNCVVKHAENNVADWDNYLQQTAFAIRDSMSRATGVRPSELVMGRKLKSPADLVIEVDDNSKKRSLTFSERQAKDFVTELTQKIQKTVNFTRQNLNRSRTYQKTQYDKNVKGDVLRVNDVVMLWYPYHKRGMSKCFVPKWIGPWEIKEFSGQSNCKIQSSKGDVKWVNVDQLKRIENRNPNLPTTMDLLDDFPEVTDNEDDNDMSDCVMNNGDAVANQEDVEGQELQVILPPVRGSWCDVDVNNIIPNRTRSGAIGGGV